MSALLRYSLSIVALGSGYFLAGRLGPAVASAQTAYSTEIIWLPAGVALAVLLRYGVRLWPGVALGSVALAWGAGHPLGGIVAATVGGTFTPLAGAWLLSRNGGFSQRLNRMNHVVALVLYGGFIAGLIGAGMAALWALFIASGAPQPLTAGLFSWLGHASGVLLIAPLLLLWGGERNAWRLPRPLGETLTAFGLLILATGVGFGVLPLLEDRGLPLAFTPLPFLVWIALRLPLQWVMVAIVLTVLIAGFGTASGQGPFARLADPQNQLVLWTFGITVSLTTLILGIATDGKRRATERLQHLARVVERIGAVHELSELASIVRRAARELTGADGATLVLREGDQCHYADEDAIGPLWQGQRFALASCISGWAMLHDRSVAIEDIYADPRISHEAYRPTFVQSLAMVPIGHGEPRGAIGCYWANRHQATRDELMLHQALADAAAVGLANIDLYQRLDMMRREAEVTAAELRASEHFKERVLTASLNGFCLYDLKAGRFDFVNEQYTQLTGYTLDALNALTVEQFLDLFHPSDVDAISRHRVNLANAAEDETFDLEYRFRHADGRWIWLLSHDAVFDYDPDGSIRRVLGTFVDITARREGEEQARVRRADSARAQQRAVVTEVATSLADGLNQPLTAVTNYCEAALSIASEACESPPQLRSVLMQACDEAQRASKVARQLRDLIGWEGGTRTVEELDAMIADTLDQLSHEIKRHGARVYREAGQAAVRVSVDRRQMEQVLIGLLQNSLEAMERAASPVREIVIRTAQRDNRAEMTVQDTGPALRLTPGESLLHLWKPGDHHGSGIDLSACRSIVEAHGGRLQAEPGRLRGAVVRFALPLARREAEQLRP